MNIRLLLLFIFLLFSCKNKKDFIEENENKWILESTSLKIDYLIGEDIEEEKKNNDIYTLDFVAENSVKLNFYINNKIDDIFVVDQSYSSRYEIKKDSLIIYIKDKDYNFDIPLKFEKIENEKSLKLKFSKNELINFLKMYDDIEVYGLDKIFNELVVQYQFSINFSK